MNKIEIAKPCPADWDKMTPMGNGRHCGSCNKIVVDFTAMSVDEIKSYFENYEGGTCAHIRKGQMLLDESKLQKKLISLYERTAAGTSFRPIRAAALLVLGACLTLAGCGPTTGEIIDRNAKVTGDSIFVTSNVDSIQKADSLKAFEEAAGK